MNADETTERRYRRFSLTVELDETQDVSVARHIIEVCMTRLHDIHMSHVKTTLLETGFDA